MMLKMGARVLSAHSFPVVSTFRLLSLLSPYNFFLRVITSRAHDESTTLTTSDYY